MKGEFVILASCDFLVESFARFILRGASHFQRRQFLKLAGDATHDECNVNLKKYILGGVGQHYSEGKWRNKFIPGIMAFCMGETGFMLRHVWEGLKEIVKQEV